MDNKQILIIPLITGITLSALATSLIGHWETSNQQLRFQKQTENLSTALQRSLNRYTDVVAFLGDYYATEQEPIARSSFSKFVSRALQSYSGVKALEWAPLIPHDQRLSYEKHIQSQGYPDFHIRELNQYNELVMARERPYYFPVTYIEPLEDNESALGYDLNSHPARAAAIAKGIKTGEITVTGRIRLVQEKRDKFGFLVFLPIAGHQGNSATESKFPVVGVLLGVFRLSDVVEESLENLQYDVNFIVSDRDGNPGEEFLGQYDATSKQVITQTTPLTKTALHRSLCSAPYVCTQTLKVGQREWRIEFSPSVNYPLETQYGTIATLITGCLLTACIVILVHNLSRDLEKTQSLNELRARFFSMASHELRTPLSTILLSSESLQINYAYLTDAQKQMNIQRINLTARQMGQQINDLLMLTRAEVQELEFSPEIFDLEDFCQKIIGEINLNTTHPIGVSFHGKLNQVFLDKKLLRSILTNILDNALKYSSPNTPIQLKVTQNTHNLIWEIQDSGIGILPIDKQYICIPFYRGSNVGEIRGTGLGLAIVKACIERHQGDWKIESNPGQGTLITVRLPIID